MKIAEICAYVNFYDLNKWGPYKVRDIIIVS